MCTCFKNSKHAYDQDSIREVKPPGHTHTHTHSPAKAEEEPREGRPVAGPEAASPQGAESADQQQQG